MAKHLRGVVALLLLLLVGACTGPRADAPPSNEDHLMSDWYLSLNFEIPGGYVAAAIEQNGNVLARTTAPLRGRDHVGYYTARLEPAEAARLRTKLHDSGYAKAEEPRELGPDVPTVSIGEGLYGEEPQLERTFERARLEPRVAEAFEALVAHVERALESPQAALRATGTLAERRLAPRGELRFELAFESIGREAAKWPHPLMALAQGRARLALQVRELGTERLQQVELERTRLVLVRPDGSPVADAPSCTSAPGSVVKLTGSAPAYLEPGKWNAVVLVSLAEPKDSDETSVYGTWTIDLGTFEVKP
ncbi:MAG: hypothetical protein NTV21_18845 [Planctomycetota bacterium]|nr:hypothetical protein [Planctomycetota bacterium]